MKVTGVSALALPLFASLSSAFLILDNAIHQTAPSVWNFNEQKIRLVCHGCPWDGKGELSDLIFTVKAKGKTLSLNGLTINGRGSVGTNEVVVRQLPHGVPEDRGTHYLARVGINVDLRNVAIARGKPVSVDNAHITIKTVGDKVVDLRPLEILHYTDGLHQNTVSILRAHPGSQVSCNSAACKAKQLANNGIKAVGFRITLIKGKLIEHAKAFKAGCHGSKSEAVQARPHGRPHPDLMHHGRPHGMGDVQPHHPHKVPNMGEFDFHHWRGGSRPHRVHGHRHHRGIFETLAIVLYPIFFGIAAGIFTSLVLALIYKTVLAAANLFRCRRVEAPQNDEEADVEAVALLDEKFPYDEEPPKYPDDAPVVVVVAEKE